MTVIQNDVHYTEGRMIIIRDYCERDANSVGKLIADTYLEFNLSFALLNKETPFGSFSIRQIIREIASRSNCQGHTSFDGFCSGKRWEIVGVLRGRKDKLQSLFVRGDLHRQGIGRRLVEIFEQACVGQGADEIRLMSTLYAVPFYQR